MASVTVLVTIFQDPRVEATVQSVLAGARVPERILLADGGSLDGTWELCQRLDKRHKRVVAGQYPGSVAATRAAALHDVETDILVFLDADETAPATWLAALVAPIEAGDADVTGGPTRPAAAPASRAEAYVNRHDDWFYDRVVARDAASLPMGNSAWRTELVRAIGGFDGRMAGGGEDWDVNLRARAHGARFRYVPEAWVYHDQRHLDSLPKLWKRMRRYTAGGTVAFLKNKALAERGGHVARRGRVWHPYTFMLATAKAVGVLDGWRRWRRMKRP